MEETTTKAKGNLGIGKKIFACSSLITCMSRHIKQIPTAQQQWQQKRNQATQLKNGRKDLKTHSFKENILRTHRNEWKNAKHHWILWKFKSEPMWDITT